MPRQRKSLRQRRQLRRERQQEEVTWFGPKPPPGYEGVFDMFDVILKRVVASGSWESTCAAARLLSTSGTHFFVGFRHKVEP